MSVDPLAMPPPQLLLWAADAATRELVGLMLARDGVIVSAPVSLPAVVAQLDARHPPRVLCLDLGSRGNTAAFAQSAAYARQN